MVLTPTTTISPAPQAPLDLGTDEHATNNHASSTNNHFRATPRPQLTTSTSLSTTPSSLIESPLSADRNFSRLAIANADDISDEYPSPWSFATRSSLTPPQDQDYYTFDAKTALHHSLLDVGPSSACSPRTFTFAMITPADSQMVDDDVIPKVEEIDDENDLALDSIRDAKDPSTSSSVESPDNIPDNPSTPAGPPPPRKRGRPRKHPLPTPGQLKIAKGRSKTGCITCRRRKKKCDETKPTCLNCQKNAVVCEGYPMREIWKSGKQKLEEAVRRTSLTTIPRGLPILIDGIETDIDRRFLDHFVYDFSRVLTLINDDSNPFKEILLPMATQHTGLMHSLMCLSGSHLSARDPDVRLKERKHYHFDRALSDLRSTIAARSADKDDPELPIEDPMIASTVALCLNTICEGETRGEYRSHMDAARFLLVTQRPRNEQFRQFIVEFFQYHDVSNSLTSLDRRPVCLTGDLRLPDFVPHAPAGALLGIFDGLFHYISEITVLRDKIRQRINQGIEPSVDYQTLSEAVAIDSAIRAWEPIYPRDNQNWHAAQLYRQSTWVYLYRTIRPSRPDAKIAQVVDDGLLFLDQLPANAGAYSIMLMPLFLLGCSAFEAQQRERVKMGFESLQSYSSLRNIEPAFRVVEKVWEVMDTNTEQSWDWEKIIKDMDMDFLIT
ncbi:hypothetical protein AJ80_04388 [Polytolypa hystricis UAMH7299]|uniref:Zn(2)-C6 fungal-type domain-containing protein n=1 Tax=Polytolypa hystricis (strain UAMH7299) TaxID=1447883 RepID=A0A2B7YC55_POLH7|nr:hypothetical protein AJ80_04388 [Polytolypa hystricis UAMH7299]